MRRAQRRTQKETHERTERKTVCKNSKNRRHLYTNVDEHGAIRTRARQQQQKMKTKWLQILIDREFINGDRNTNTITKTASMGQLKDYKNK